MKAPHNIEAEQALLGAILMNNEAYHVAAPLVGKDDFYEQAHQEIFDVLAKIVSAGKKADPITAKTQLRPDLMEGMTMAEYLARLATMAVTVINSADYATIIRDLSKRRSLMSIADGMGYQASNDNDTTPTEMVESAERALFEVMKSGQPERGFVAFKAAMTGAIEAAAAAYQHGGGGIYGLSTGLAPLDKLLGGMQDSDLIILAGRPGMGKTALATNVAYSVAMEGKKVGLFSLEMSAPQLAQRILADHTSISASDIRKGTFQESDYSLIVDAAKTMEAMFLEIDDTGYLTVAQLAGRARRLKRKKGLDFLVIDYLQLLHGSGKRQNENRVQEMTEITVGLKALAKELNIPIMALSQLSRAVEQREDKRPQLSDLRESGSIEQDADVVMFVYRQEYYIKQQEPDAASEKYKDWEFMMREVAGKAEVIIGKQRHGPTGVVELGFDARYTRFTA